MFCRCFTSWRIHGDSSFLLPELQKYLAFIERLLDRYALVAKLDEAQHVTHFTKRKIA